MKLKRGLISREQYDPARFAKDGLVLAICESNFPHQISFMLVEPCSHIQWEYSYFDSKLNVIETRQQRLNFVANLHYGLSNGILRDLANPDRALHVAPGPQKQIGPDQSKDCLFTFGRLSGIFSSQRPGATTELIYQKSFEIGEGVFRNLIVTCDYQQKVLFLHIEPLERDKARWPHLCQRHAISIDSQIEGSRIVSGCFASGLHEGVMTVSSHLKNMFYTVEVASANTDQEMVVRFTLFDQATQSCFASMTFVD